MKSRIISFFAIVSVLASCNGFHKPELVEIRELLPVGEDVVFVDASGGEASLKFYATSEVIAEIVSGAGSGVQMISPSSFEGDGTEEWLQSNSPL